MLCIISVYNAMLWTGLVVEPNSTNVYNSQTCRQITSQHLIKWIRFVDHGDDHVIGCIVFNAVLDVDYLFEVRKCNELRPFICEIQTDRK